jgi:hypothetical protein
MKPDCTLNCRILLLWYIGFRYKAWNVLNIARFQVLVPHRLPSEPRLPNVSEVLANVTEFSDFNKFLKVFRNILCFTYGTLLCRNSSTVIGWDGFSWSFIGLEEKPFKSHDTPTQWESVIHCYVKCLLEIDWLVKQSKVQYLLWRLVGTLAS